jgi:hypothetical protein
VSITFQAISQGVTYISGTVDSATVTPHPGIVGGGSSGSGSGSVKGSVLPWTIASLGLSGGDGSAPAELSVEGSTVVNACGP